MEKISEELSVIRDKKYNDWARNRPAYISLAIPCVYCLVYFNLYGEELSDFKYIITTLLGMSSVVGAIFFLYVFLIRDVSKILPGTILFARTIKPTTRVLLSSNNTFTDETKNLIREKINQLYQVNLDSIEDKTGKDKKYTQLIDDVVGRIRNDTRFDNILFEYNCIYGFYRNLSAGIIINIFMLIVGIVYSNYIEIPYSSTFFPLLMALIIFDVILIYFAYTSGMTYAKQMYNVFRGL